MHSVSGTWNKELHHFMIKVVELEQSDSLWDPSICTFFLLKIKVLIWFFKKRNKNYLSVPGNDFNTICKEKPINALNFPVMTVIFPSSCPQQ